MQPVARYSKPATNAKIACRMSEVREGVVTGVGAGGWGLGRSNPIGTGGGVMYLCL